MMYTRYFRKRNIALNLCLIVLYFTAAKIGLTMAFIQEQVTPVWPPSGISLAFILLWGITVWPGILIGAFVANISLDEPIWVAFFIAIGNTLEAVAARFLLKRFAGFKNILNHLRDVISLVILASLLSTMISATIGVSTLALSKLMPVENFWSVWETWWLGDAMGILIVTPVILTWISTDFYKHFNSQIIEFVILFMITAAAGHFIFSSFNRLEYLVFPFVLWGAIRFGQSGSTCVILTLSLFAVWYTATGQSHLVMDNVQDTIIMLTLYLMIIAITGMVIAAVTSERLLALEGLKAHREVGKMFKLNENRLESLLFLNQMSDVPEKKIREYALESVVELTNSNAGYLHFVNEDAGTIDLVSWSSAVMKICAAEKTSHYPITQAGIWADSIRLRRPVIHNDYQSMPDKKGYPEGHFPVVRHLSVPIFDGDKIVAVAGVGNKEEPYNDFDITQFTLFMNNMWSTIKRNRMEELLKKYSLEDSLTGLANRRKFFNVYENEWRRAIRDSISIAVVLIDVDFFKQYNDVYGHQGGDECLRKIADCLRISARRPGDLIARYGGEEFIVLLHNTELAGAKNVAGAMCRSVYEMKIRHKGSPDHKYVSISAGTASLIPNSDAHVDYLIELADNALYQAKHDGRNCARANEMQSDADL